MNEDWCKCSLDWGLRLYGLHICKFRNYFSAWISIKDVHVAEYSCRVLMKKYSLAGLTKVNNQSVETQPAINNDRHFLKSIMFWCHFHKYFKDCQLMLKFHKCALSRKINTIAQSGMWTCERIVHATGTQSYRHIAYLLCFNILSSCGI